MHLSNNRCSLGSCFILLALWPLAAHAQPSLTGAAPAAVLPGATTQVTLQGAKLDQPLNIWTSFPAKIEIVPPADGKPNPAAVVCNITLDPNVPVGIGGVIVGTAEGVSDTLWMLVDDLPSVPAIGSNTSLAAAQEITIPTAIDGMSPGSASAFYRFAAKAGQRLTVDVVARRMASPLDPVVWLRDAQGRELAYADDDASLGTDCRLSYTFAADGQYVVEIRDNSFAGGRRYRLRIGDFPVVTSAYPLGGKIGAPTTFNFAGPGTTAIEPTVATLTAPPLGNQATIGARYPGGTVSALVTVAATNLTEALEAEPNNEIAVATKVVAPCAVNGIMQAANDKDLFQFDAKTGQRLVFTSFSRSLGSPTYVALKILKSDGAQVAASSVGDAEEQTLSFVIPADGTYLLAVEDLLRRGGAEFTYRVSIDESAGFTLSIKHNPPTDAAGNSYKRLLSTGGAFAMDVEAKRDGYDGPIMIDLLSPVGKFNLQRNVIAEKQTVANLIVTPPAEWKEGAFTTLRVVGRAKVNEKDIEVAADTFNIMRAKWSQIAYPPAWHDGLFALAGAKPIDPFFGVKLNSASAFFPRGVGKVDLIVTPDRKHQDFKAGLTVFVEGAPAGVAATVTLTGTVPAETYLVSLTGPKDLAEGEHKIRIIGYAELNGRGQQVVAEVPVKVVNPLAVTVTPAGPLVVGQKQKVKLTVARQMAESDRQPVTLKWKTLPAGVTGPGEVTLAAAADQLEIDVELTAAADAAVGKFDALVVEAVSKLQGQDIVGASPPASLEVKAP